MAGIVGNDRDNLLATFQAATGLDDIGTSISVLEQYGWNLVEAINSIMPQAYAVEESSQGSEGMTREPVFGGRKSHSTSPINPPAAAEATVEIIITFLWEDGSLPLSIPITHKIGQIKQDLKRLLPWVGRNEVTISMEKESPALEDELSIDQLSLPSDLDGKFLYVTAHVDSNQNSSANNGMCHIKVKYNNHLIELQLSPTSTLKELKTQASRRCGLSTDFQRWVGLPPGLSDHALLQDAGLNHGEHVLTLESVQPAKNYSTTSTATNTVSTSGRDNNRACTPAGSTSSTGSEEYTSAQSSEDDGDDFEMDMDSLSTDPTPVAPPALAPLIPPDCTNPLEALNSFTHQFSNRYGSVHPIFFIGSLADAVKEATSVQAAQRKPLLIYLHHDRSILSNVFCSQLLCAESIVNYLSQNFVSWAWDLTAIQQRDRLLEMVRESFGNDAARNVMSVEPDNLPIMLIVFKSKGQVEVRNVIQGFTEVDLLMGALLLAVEEHQLAAEHDAAEEQQRIARERMIMEQDMAYQESLAQDKEKAKRAEEEQRTVELAKEREAQAKIQLMRQEEEKKKQCEEQLSAEPAAGVKDVTTIRLRCPDGSTLVRRFNGGDKLRVLFIYTGSKGYSDAEYKLLSSFPRRDITTLNGSMTFKEAKLFPQETVFVEERTD